jgi:hypothetical protein
MNKKGQIFALIFYIIFLFVGITLLYIWYTSPDLSARCSVSIEEQITPLILFISGTGLVCIGLIGLWTIFRTGTSCWGDILEGKPEAIELLHERIKRLKKMPNNKNKAKNKKKNVKTNNKTNN